MGVCGGGALTRSLDKKWGGAGGVPATPEGAWSGVGHRARKGSGLLLNALPPLLSEGAGSVTTHRFVG